MPGSLDSETIRSARSSRNADALPAEQRCKWMPDLSNKNVLGFSAVDSGLGHAGASSTGSPGNRPSRRVSAFGAKVLHEVKSATNFRRRPRGRIRTRSARSNGLARSNCGKRTCSLSSSSAKIDASTLSCLSAIDHSRLIDGFDRRQRVSGGRGSSATTKVRSCQEIWLSRSEQLALRKAVLSKGENDIFTVGKTLAGMNAGLPVKDKWATPSGESVCSLTITTSNGLIRVSRRRCWPTAGFSACARRCVDRFKLGWRPTRWSWEEGGYQEVLWRRWGHFDVVVEVTPVCAI